MYDYKELNKFADGLWRRGFAIEARDVWGGKQAVARDKDGNYIGDAILHNGSYGREQNLIEIMGFGINDEEDGDEVVGYLTAEKALQYVDRYLGRK